jgi:hypothetical protein
MKKKKNKGCIYWDESSRGVSIDRPRGRWVGERLENGKRVRMRSTNYNNVLKWVMGNNTDCPRRQIKGFPDYFINIERREVFGKRGTPMKGEVRSNRTIYKLKKDKVTYKIPFACIAYAALHDIDPRKIPTDIVVVESNGKYILQNICDFQTDNAQRMQKNKRERIKNILRKRRRETDILLRYYRTNDTTELVTYVTTGIQESTVSKVIRKNHCSIQRAKDIVAEAQERFLQRVINGNLPTISISATILALCNQCTREKARRREYNDNILQSHIL